ncbi:hypothetical protein ACFW5P_05235 [Streptomyces rochei]|uniref:hypothetical protein n=1 Tax=Streptomyces rochei TaxID=1928 RepID=UPI00369566C0
MHRLFGDPPDPHLLTPDEDGPGGGTACSWTVIDRRESVHPYEGTRPKHCRADDRE